MLNLRRGRYRKPSRESHVDIQAVIHVLLSGGCTSSEQQDSWPVICRLVSCSLTPAEWEGSVISLHGLKPCRTVQLRAVGSGEELGEVCLDDTSVLFESRTSTSVGETEWSAKVYATLRQAAESSSSGSAVIRVRCVLTGAFPVVLGNGGKSSVSFGDEFLVNVEDIAGRTKEETRWNLVVASWRIRAKDGTSAYGEELLDAVLLPLDAHLNVLLCTNAQFHSARNLQDASHGDDGLKAFFLPQFVSREAQTPRSASETGERKLFDRSEGRLVSVQTSAPGTRQMILATKGNSVVMLPCQVRATIMVFEEPETVYLREACRALATFLKEGGTSTCVFIDEYNWLAHRSRLCSDSSPLSRSVPKGKPENKVDLGLSPQQGANSCGVTQTKLSPVSKNAPVPTHGQDPLSANTGRHNNIEMANPTTLGAPRSPTHVKKAVTRPHLTRVNEINFDDADCQSNSTQTKQSDECHSVELIFPYFTVSYSDAEEVRPALPAKKKAAKCREGSSTAPLPSPRKTRTSLPPPITTSSLELESKSRERSFSMPKTAELSSSQQSQNGSKQSEDDCVYVEPNPMPVYELVSQVESSLRVDRTSKIPVGHYLEFS